LPMVRCTATIYMANVQTAAGSMYFCAAKSTTDRPTNRKRSILHLDRALRFPQPRKPAPRTPRLRTTPRCAIMHPKASQRAAYAAESHSASTPVPLTRSIPPMERADPDGAGSTKEVSRRMSPETRHEHFSRKPVLPSRYGLNLTSCLQIHRMAAKEVEY
jgi:hypothetical protein